MQITISPAQLVVLKELLRDGGSNRKIARRLFITDETVKSHLQRIYAKACVADRTELVVAVLTGKVVVNGVAHRVQRRALQDGWVEDTQRHEPDHRGVAGPAGGASGVRPQPQR